MEQLHFLGHKIIADGLRVTVGQHLVTTVIGRFITNVGWRARIHCGT
jgi:hypothetical protein